jgi:hypothetical protein
MKKWNYVALFEILHIKHSHKTTQNTKMMKLYTRRRGLLIFNIYKKKWKMDLKLIIDWDNGEKKIKILNS